MTTTRNRTLAGAALLLALSGGLAGCGGGDDDEGSDAAPTSAPTSTPSSTSTADPSSAPTSGDATEPVTPSAENADYCDEVTVLSGIGSNEALDTDGAVKQLLIAIEAVAAAAPPEVADEWADVAPAFEEYVEYVSEKYVDSTNPPAGVTQEQATARNTATVQEALKKLEPVQAQIATIGDHAQKACGVGTF